MKVDVVIRVEVADQKAAESWAASVCEMVRPKCPTCRGKGEIEGAPFPYRSNRTCPHCDGRGSLPHPYKPEVMGSYDPSEPRPSTPAQIARLKEALRPRNLRPKK